MSKGYKLKCPFLTRVVTISQPIYKNVTIEELDEEEQEYYSVCSDDGDVLYLDEYKGSYEIMTENHMDCIKEECAMWEDGKCLRRG